MGIVTEASLLADSAGECVGGRGGGSELQLYVPSRHPSTMQRRLRAGKTMQPDAAVRWLRHREIERAAF
jgi:hypothetical protein